MSVSSFGRVPSLSVEEVRHYCVEHDRKSFTLLDVRQPTEYEEGHLPGARLLPVGELADRLEEVDGSKPVIAYCRSGGRGASAVSTLLHAGFEKVWNMTGGITAWRGAVAFLPPEVGMALFDACETILEHVSLAIQLEEGARRFYEAQARRFGATPSGQLFASMALDEVRHKEMLARLLERFTGESEAPPPPSDVMEQEMMEGGLALSQALAWSEGRPPADVLDFAAALEANAYDRYLFLADAAAPELSSELFRAMAREEKAHLLRFLELFEQVR